MAENSSSGNSGGKPTGAAGATGTPGQPAASGVLRPPNAAGGQQAPAAGSVTPRTAPSPAPPSSLNSLTNAPVAQATVKCPKCGAAVREVARFCQRCHNTMRYECPSCGHKQRSGGNCEKCGINFIKYVGAVVAGKRAQADAIHDNLEQRSTLMKNLLIIPFTGGISLIRQLFVGRDRKS
ncbi:MAG: zinc-ribbon domain-containing protein [Candidatus Acidiferrales bacterium]